MEKKKVIVINPSNIKELQKKYSLIGTGDISNPIIIDLSSWSSLKGLKFRNIDKHTTIKNSSNVILSFSKCKNIYISNCELCFLGLDHCSNFLIENNIIGAIWFKKLENNEFIYLKNNYFRENELEYINKNIDSTELANNSGASGSFFIEKWCNNCLTSKKCPILWNFKYFGFRPLDIRKLF